MVANASLAASRGYEAIEEELWQMLAETRKVDAEEDWLFGSERRGDELPEGLGRRVEQLRRLEGALFGMVLNRLLVPDSKLGAYEWLKQEVYHPDFESLELHHLYRALDFLDEHKRTMEEALFLKDRDLFGLDVDLVFFDTTSTYFEGRGPRGLAELGYSRDRRPDRVQVVIRLVMTRDGIPVAHYIFPGNTADIAAFRNAVADLKGRFAVRRVVVVADRGVVSEPLLEALNKEEVGYIVGIPLKKWRAADRVLRQAGHYHEVAENLRVKEVWDNNREREPEDARKRMEIVAALEAEWASWAGQTEGISALHQGAGRWSCRGQLGEG